MRRDNELGYSREILSLHYAAHAHQRIPRFRNSRGLHMSHSSSIFGGSPLTDPVLEAKNVFLESSWSILWILLFVPGEAGSFSEPDPQ